MRERGFQMKGIVSEGVSTLAVVRSHLDETLPLVGCVLGCACCCITDLKSKKGSMRMGPKGRPSRCALRSVSVSPLKVAWGCRLTAACACSVLPLGCHRARRHDVVSCSTGSCAAFTTELGSRSGWTTQLGADHTDAYVRAIRVSTATTAAAATATAESLLTQRWSSHKPAMLQGSPRRCVARDVGPRCEAQ